MKLRTSAFAPGSRYSWVPIFLISVLIAPEVQGQNVEVLHDATIKMWTPPWLEGSMITEKILNGRVQLDLLGKEFVSFQDEVEFTETPPRLNGRWLETDRTTSNAEWRLYRRTPDVAPGYKILASASLGGGTYPPGETRVFVIPDLRDHLPLYNDGPEAKEYFVTVVARQSRGRGQSEAVSSGSARLVHLPQGSVGEPAALNPYVCPSRGSAHARAVTLRLQSLLSTNNTTTGNEGKDEVYFRIQGISFTKDKGTSIGSIEHQPEQADPDFESMQEAINAPKNHFSVEEGKLVRLGEIVDAIEAGVFPENMPGMSKETLEERSELAEFVIEHGEAVAVTVNIQESDNKALKDIKVAMSGLLKAVGVVAAAFGQVYVTAGAEVLDQTAVRAIPPVDRDDFLGTFSVLFDNRCGFVRTTWVAGNVVDSQSSNDVSQKFVLLTPGGASQELTPVVSNASVFPTVMFADDPSQTKFNPYGWDNYDFGVWKTPVQLWPETATIVDWNKVDMLLDTQGTSNSAYNFKLRAFTEIPDE